MAGSRTESGAPWIIDTHAFAFSPAFMRENHLPEEIDGTFDTLAEDMEKAKVERTFATVFVTKQDDIFESVATGLKRHPGRISAQLNLSPNHPDFAASNVRAAAGDRRVVGARAALSIFKLHPVDESLEKVWDACEAASLPVQVVVDSSKFCQPSSFKILARERPALNLVLSFARSRHREGFKELARFPGVFFQVPGLLDAEVKTGEPAFLLWSVKHLPHERLMFGSDRLGHEASYLAKVAALEKLPPHPRAQVGRETALELYGKRLRAQGAG